MTADGLLSEEQLGAAAFDMLASSALGRYEHVARKHVGRTDLSARVTDEKALPALLDHVRRLWSVVEVQQERGLEEIELALVLIAFDAAATVTPIRPTLEAIAAAAGRSPSGWMPALARRLLARHAPRREFRDVKWLGGSKGRHRELQETPCM